MIRAATILGIVGGLWAVLLGCVGFDLSADELGTYAMYVIGFALIPLGLVAIAGAILGRSHRTVSLGLLVASGLAMLFIAASFLVVAWRDPTLTISPANIGLLGPGVLTLLAAMFSFLARPKVATELSRTGQADTPTF
jgi:hypothetical protein